MNIPLSPLQPQPQRQKERYIPVKHKFLISHVVAWLWMGISIYLSIPWLKDLKNLIGFPLAVVVITGLAYIPGYLTAFFVISLLLDRQPPFKTEDPKRPVTILIAARNEAKRIANTIAYIAKQDYNGDIHLLLVDNDSSDGTAQVAKEAADQCQLPIEILEEKELGKFHALNRGLAHVRTDYVITLDADTLLHRSAVRYLIARMESAPADVCAVAGAVLVRNSRENLLTKMQEWDYFLGIASIKRMQGLYQGTLVAQGAYSLYKVECLRTVGGWPNAIGEDIVLSWRLLERGWKIYFEPQAVAFTDVPSSWRHFCRQRARWARGMIEALKAVKPWQQPQGFVKYLTMINLVLPYLDAVYTLCWLPGFIAAWFGYYYIVGPMTLWVIPLSLLAYGALYRYQRYVFRMLGLRVRRNRVGFVLFVLCYQMIMSPVSFFGYLQEWFRLQRIWK
ncbi:glycosyltransferase [Geobacillus sp. FSL W8-0032]|uniref:Glycosyltransferase family 2 protein n=1 Tax=Geobacillus icigianus TaxID=1430331 RepID=A0ABU6BD72_9BACL|nr:glycosyltransferase [Geobacillus icigianus]MEB3749775.1 hypothetical protein [Geobacillus icigianus]